MMDSVKKAFVLGVKALKLFYVILAAAVITNTLTFLIVPEPPVDVEMSIGRSFLIIGWFIFLLFFLGPFLAGGSLTYIKELIKTGSASLASFLDNAKKYFLRFLAVTALLFLIMLIVTIALNIIRGIAPEGLRALITVVNTIISISVNVLFVMCGIAVVGSDLGAVESIKKGILIGRKNFLKILGILLILALVLFILFLLVAVISAVVSLMLPALFNLMMAVVMAVVFAIWGFLSSIAYMDFYLKS